MLTIRYQSILKICRDSIQSYTEPKWTLMITIILALPSCMTGVRRTHVFVPTVRHPVDPRGASHRAHQCKVTSPKALKNSTLRKLDITYTLTMYLKHIFIYLSIYPLTIDELCESLYFGHRNEPGRFLGPLGGVLWRLASCWADWADGTGRCSSPPRNGRSLVSTGRSNMIQPVCGSWLVTIWISCIMSC